MTIAAMGELTSTVLTALWRASWQAAVLAGLVLAVQWILRKQLSARWRHNLWLLVLLRLAIPVTPPAPFSVFNLTRHLPDTPAAAIPIAPRIALDDATTPATDAPAAAKPFPWLPIGAAIWAFGVLALATRTAIASVRLSRAVRKMTRVDDPKVLELLQKCGVELGVATPPVVLTSPDLPAPALMGFLRPRLLLPAHVLADFQPAELRLIALHELAHLKRHDVAINWLIAILQAIHWFNPMLWLAFARLRVDRELAADELVLAATAEPDRHQYGQTIVKLLQSLSHRPAQLTPLPGTIGILERAHPLRRRITMIAQFHNHAKRWTAVAAAAMLLLACFALTDAVRGDDAAAPAPAKPTELEQKTIKMADGKIVTTNDFREPTTGPVTSPPSRAFHKDEEKTYLDFQRRLPEMSFDAIGFADVIDFIRDVTGSNITVNWQALEGAGIDRNAPITMKLRDVTLEQVLRQLLRQAGGGTVQLAFSLDGNIIVISTVEESHGRPRSYDVTDLMAESSKGAELKKVVMDNVAPSSWEEAGGTNGTINILGNKLIISTTDINHLEIDRLLAELRRSHDAK